MMKPLILMLAAMASVPAAAASPSRVGGGEEEARIPFVSLNGVRNFHAVGKDVVYIQDARRNWYRASLMTSCLNLPFAQAIGVDTRGTNSLDRFSTLILEGERCQLQSLVRSGPPPKKEKRAKRG